MTRQSRQRNAVWVIASAGALCVASIVTGCAPTEGSKGTMNIQQAAYGETPDGKQVELYTLTNNNGMSAGIITYGGIVVTLDAPDRDGKMADIVLGMDDLQGYVSGHPFFGAIAGRYANRIAKGKFTLDGKEYTLATNNDPNHLHGGIKGFDKQVWAAAEVEDKNAVGLELSYTSADGEEGYPGALKCTVTYWLTNDNELKIVYDAETDKATPINLTNHSYFNLKGQGEGDILGHEMTIYADRCTPVDDTLIPTGELASVEGTPLDFRTATTIGARVDADHEQIKFGGGYDHNFVLNSQDGSLALAATVHEPTTGRVMEVLTTEPGVQFYCGNFLDGSDIGKGGKVYQRRNGFCLETQHYPDSPNKPDFPTTILKPGERYATTTIYKFSAK